MSALRPIAIDLAAERERRTAPPTGPGAKLASARVDLAAAISRSGTPREYVAGVAGLIPRGKRLHVSASRKTGKSLAFAVVLAVEVAAAGGTVAVLDRENGADEYTRRLRTVLAARGDDTSDALLRRLRYFDFPALALDWRTDPGYVQAFAGVDLVIFDSSRSHTAPLGIKEDSSDDWAAFSGALIDPLAQAGVATVVLDNTGHEAKGRARGTTAKEDLADLAYTLKVLKPFSIQEPGELQLQTTASRLGEIATGSAWNMKIGGGIYGTFTATSTRASAPDAGYDRAKAEAVYRAIESNPSIGKRALREKVRGSHAEIDQAVSHLIDSGRVRLSYGDRGAHQYETVSPYRADHAQACRDCAPAQSTGPCPADSPPKGGTEAGTLPQHDQAQVLDRHGHNGEGSA